MKKVGVTWIPDEEDWFDRFLKGGVNKYEMSHTNAALSMLKKREKNVFVDVGGHYGTWCVRLSPNFKKVMSFEPYPPSFECLKRNTEHLSNVEVFNMALGEETGGVDIGLIRDKPQEFQNLGRLTIIGEGEIPMKPLDDFNLDGLDLLKVDVEGYEIHVLRGAQETIKKYKPVIVFEENSRGKMDHNVELGTCGEFLKSLGAVKQMNRSCNFYYKFLD